MVVSDSISRACRLALRIHGPAGVEAAASGHPGRGGLPDHARRQPEAGMRARLSAGAVRCDWLARESLAACRSAVAPESATQSHARRGPRRARARGSRWTCGEPGPGRSSCVPTRLDPVSPHERFPPPFPRPPESRSRLLLCGGCTPRHEKNSAGRSSTVCKSNLSVRPRFAAELPWCTPVRERGRFLSRSGDGSVSVQGTVPFRFTGVQRSLVDRARLLEVDRTAPKRIGRLSDAAHRSGPPPARGGRHPS